MATGTISMQNRVKVVRQTAVAQTIAVNQLYQWAITPGAISGYTPVGIVGWYIGTNNAAVTVFLCRQWTLTEIQFGVRNESANSVTITPTVDILYIKN